MQLIRRIGLILLWLVAPAFAFASANKNDPYLISVRGAGNVALVLVSVAVVVLLLRRGHGRRFAGKLLIILWCLPPLLMLTAHLAFELRTREVLAASSAETRQLGPHFIVGFSSFPEVAPGRAKPDRWHLPAQHPPRGATASTSSR
jgi:beta-N-acetylhexosaminidase